MYPTTMGSHHMRSKLVKTPPLFTDYLKKAGYTICWPTAGGGGIGKTDFNFDPPKGWADVTVDWTKKPEVLKPPFFAVYNITVTHESQARATHFQYARNTARLKPAERRDPAKVKLPPYYPDTVPVRDCVAIYHDNITAMDYAVGDVLKLLDDQKLTDNTVVVFYGDHGWGLSRGKRWPYDSGLRVPVPRPLAGERSSPAACATISFASSTSPRRCCRSRVRKSRRTCRAASSLARKPARLRSTSSRPATGWTRRTTASAPFAASAIATSATSIPNSPTCSTSTTWTRCPSCASGGGSRSRGSSTRSQMLFMSRTKPKEELYDLDSDPHEINNLANAESVEIQGVRKEMSDALDKWIVDTKDLGEVPEKELIKRGLVRDVLSTEYDARVKLHPKAPPVP